MNLAGNEVLLVVVWLVLLVLPLVALIDVLRHADAEFAAIGQSRTTWIVLLVVTGLFCGIVGAIMGLYELVAVRPKLAAT